MLLARDDVQLRGRTVLRDLPGLYHNKGQLVLHVKHLGNGMIVRTLVHDLVLIGECKFSRVFFQLYLVFGKLIVLFNDMLHLVYSSHLPLLLPCDHLSVAHKGNQVEPLGCPPEHRGILKTIVLLVLAVHESLTHKGELVLVSRLGLNRNHSLVFTVETKDNHLLLPRVGDLLAVEVQELAV